MTVIARRECPEHGADLGDPHHLRRLAGLCAHCGREQMIVEYVPAKQLQGAVSDRDALLTYIHRSDHLKPAEGCPDCAAVLDALDLYRGGQ